MPDHTLTENGAPCEACALRRAEAGATGKPEIRIECNACEGGAGAGRSPRGS